jgi:uncharacterized SAM-binding protein YcdF (DUF218 family)
VPTEPDQAAIVIFGAAVRRGGRASGTLRRRVEAAAAFGAGLDAPLFVPTGGVGRFPPAEAAVMQSLLVTLGVPPARIMPEDTGTDTLSSVRAVARLLRTRGHRGTVYAASSGYHLPRCVLLLRLAGLPARPSPPPQASNAALARLYWGIREVPAILYDALLLVALRLARRL